MLNTSENLNNRNTHSAEESDVTLLIPTKDRSDFLIRLLNYYLALKFQGFLYIGDSSVGEHARKTQEVIKSLEGRLNILYREYPDLNDAMCRGELLKLVNTKYAAYVADDDFLVPASLRKCAEFLDANSNYSTAHGVAAVIDLETSGAYGRVASASHYRQPVIESETASQRLLDYLSNYSVNMFSLQRVEYWKEIYKYVSTTPDIPFAGELMPSCLSVIQGKVKELDCFYLARQAHDRRYLNPTVFQWIATTDWLPSYRRFIESLSQEIVKQDGISEGQAVDIVEKAFVAHLTRVILIRSGGGYVEKKVSLKAQIKIKVGIIPGSKLMWRKINSFLPGKTNGLTLDSMRRDSSHYHDDFMPVHFAMTQER